MTVRKMRYLIINTKNYPEVAGKRIDAFLRATKESSPFSKGRSAVYLSLPAFYIGYASESFPSLKLLAQHLDSKAAGSTTGYLIPEIAKASGALGSLINHSEHRLEDSQHIAELIARLGNLKMKSVVCARDIEEVRRLTPLAPDFIAIEPPELIGSGNAVSKVRPDVIIESRKVMEEFRPTNAATKLLCGAGIVDEVDARTAIELGADGILVSSAVVKSKNWKSKIESLLRGINDAKQRVPDSQLKSG
jgi:triosephosphate isomerase (TIM)